MLFRPSFLPSFLSTYFPFLPLFLSQFEPGITQTQRCYYLPCCISSLKMTQHVRKQNQNVKRVYDLMILLNSVQLDLDLWSNKQLHISSRFQSVLFLFTCNPNNPDTSYKRQCFLLVPYVSFTNFNYYKLSMYHRSGVVIVISVIYNTRLHGSFDLIQYGNLYDKY